MFVGAKAMLSRYFSCYFFVLLCLSPVLCLTYVLVMPHLWQITASLSLSDLPGQLSF